MAKTRTKAKAKTKSRTSIGAKASAGGTRAKAALKVRSISAPFAQARLGKVLMAVREIPATRRLGPGKRLAASWQVELELVGAPVMQGLNAHYRGKEYATDVLSFPSPPVFYGMGHLGELVVCLPVLKKQAKELGHSVEVELDVLLVHGVLHLLGLDHEHGEQEAEEMKKLEVRVLERLGRKTASALIGRSRSGKS